MTTTETTASTAGQTDPSAEDPTEATTAGQPGDPDSAPEDDHGDDPGDDDEDQDQDPQGGQPNRERRLRQRAQAAEAERDVLAATLAQTRQSIVDSAVAAAGYLPERFGRLLVAAERTPDTLLDDHGLIDTTRLGDAIAATAEEFNVTARVGLTPNPVQGTRGGQSHGASSWSTALKG